MHTCFEQLESNECIIENYKEAVKIFNNERGKPDTTTEMAVAYGAIIMFGVFLDEIEKGNLTINEVKK